MASALINDRNFATPHSLNAAIKSICDILRRSNCAGALQYIPELSWILFLRILDERETIDAERAEAVGALYQPSIDSPFRWRDWGAPGGFWRVELTQNATLGALFKFINGDPSDQERETHALIPYLRTLAMRPNPTARQKVISQIMSGVERTRVDTEKNFLDVLDKLHEIHPDGVDQTHMFALSQAYEGLLQRMGERGSDGGQFFTPREIIRVIVRVVNPTIGETIYDPACGTGGFIAQSYEHMAGPNYRNIKSPADLETLKFHTFFGREKDNAVYPIALANLVLHGIDEPHVWHGNTLTGAEIYGGLFQGAPPLYHVIMMNPPFGGKEGRDARTRFIYKTRATQVLFLQHVIDALRVGGRCGIVLDEGVLFRNNETAFVKTKRKLLDDCDLFCIVSLPPGVFVSAGAGVKTNLLFFNRDGPTERIWYYDLSDIKVGKKTPLTIDKFEEFFRLLPTRSESERSWTVTREEIERRNFDLKAVNPYRKPEQDTRTAQELLNLIDAKGREVSDSISKLRDMMRST